MSREQLLANLGTIASSGTRKFMEAMKEQKGNMDNNLIGQVGTLCSEHAAAAGTAPGH